MTKRRNTEHNTVVKCRWACVWCTFESRVLWLCGSNVVVTRVWHEHPEQHWNPDDLFMKRLQIFHAIYVDLADTTQTNQFLLLFVNSIVTLPFIDTTSKLSPKNQSKIEQKCTQALGLILFILRTFSFMDIRGSEWGQCPCCVRDASECSGLEAL